MNLPIRRNHWLRRVVFALFFIAVVVVLVWSGAFPDKGDPRNIRYVLWKHGLNKNMDLDNALFAMLRDGKRERQVQGLTKDQLKARFGYVRTLAEVTPYYRACYFSPGVFTEGDGDRAEIAAKSEDAFFLRDSPWMVAMKNGKVVELTLCKGY